MAHARRTLREAIAGLLDNSMVAYARVYESRLLPMQQTWPHVAVYAESETSEALTIHAGHPQAREVRIVTEGRLQISSQGDETMEDRMDAVAAEIETKLTETALRAVFAKLKLLQLTDTTPQLVPNENTGELAYAAITLGWRVEYMTTEGSPETPV